MSQSSTRKKILANIRANRASAAELPSLEQAWTCYDDLLGQFISMVEATGGQAEVVSSTQAANDWVIAQPGYAEAKQRLSVVEGIGESNVPAEGFEQPHDWNQLDWALLPGEWGVAENGAIWVTDEGVPHRSVYFLCEHLTLVIPASRLVHNMHQAYEQIDGYADADHPPFGAFIAGPSKTADIEQSLVIGAQGPRSLQVLVVQAS